MSTSSSDRSKGLLKRLLTLNLGGCGCGKARPADVVQPKPLPNPNPSNCLSTSTSVENYDLTSTTFSCNSSDGEAEAEIRRDPTTSKIGGSVTVVKESVDPYRDFRESMAQMVLEKEIYAEEGLEELLSRFLELNRPRHHESIVRAFTEVWNSVVLPEMEKRRRKAVERRRR